VPSPGNDHLATAEDEADDFGIVESVDETGELLRLVLDLVERQMEGQIVEVELPGQRC